MVFGGQAGGSPRIRAGLKSDRNEVDSIEAMARER